jgi:hypothetical protein
VEGLPFKVSSAPLIDRIAFKVISPSLSPRDATRAEDKAQQTGLPTRRPARAKTNAAVHWVDLTRFGGSHRINLHFDGNGLIFLRGKLAPKSFVPGQGSVDGRYNFLPTAHLYSESSANLVSQEKWLVAAETEAETFLGGLDPAPSPSERKGIRTVVSHLEYAWDVLCDEKDGNTAARQIFRAMRALYPVVNIAALDHRGVTGGMSHDLDAGSRVTTYKKTETLVRIEVRFGSKFFKQFRRAEGRGLDLRGTLLNLRERATVVVGPLLGSTATTSSVYSIPEDYIAIHEACQPAHTFAPLVRQIMGGNGVVSTAGECPPAFKRALRDLARSRIFTRLQRGRYALAQPYSAILRDSAAEMW